MPAYFITGTGTDIGKTWLSCALLRYWRGWGRAVRAFKPVLSGFDAAHAAASDAGQLLAALGREVDVATLDEIAPWRFVAPLSPDMAAAREGRAIDVAALIAFTRRAAIHNGEESGVGADTLSRSRPISADFLTLVEGVGGAMAPLDAQHTVRDWIAASGLPCVLVTGSYLGSLSHALTALAALRAVAAPVAAIAVNETPAATVGLDETLATLRQHAGATPVIAIVRAAPQAGVAALAEKLMETLKR